jgi:AraC-like DNA-binding protein
LKILAGLSYPAPNVIDVLSTVELASGAGFAISAVSCRDDHTGWSPAEVRDGYSVVLVRRGRFRRRAAGAAADLDPTLGYLSVPGQEERFAHPAGGDVCTWLTLSPALWRLVAGDAAQVARPTMYVDARLDLAHRRVAVAAATGDVEYALVEQLLMLLAAAAGQAVAGPTPAVPTVAGDRDRALVSAAREAIAVGHPAAGGLLPLAALLGVSPYRLSRAFPRELGVSLTWYRNRVRVARVLDRLEGGEGRLAELAAELGFADQAHLCRTVREHLGHTPTALRHLLGSGASPARSRRAFEADRLYCRGSGGESRFAVVRGGVHGR